jgi:hypothetical protein
MLIATSKNKMAGRTWTATVTAISPTRQEVHQKKWRFIKTKLKMYIRKRLKRKPKKHWIWQHRICVDVDAQGIVSLAAQGIVDWASYGTTDLATLGNTWHYMHGGA